MNCQEFIDFIRAYLDGELPDETAAVFKGHIDLCPPCEHYLDGYVKTVELGKLCCDEGEELPADVPDQLIQAILKARGDDA